MKIRKIDVELIAKDEDFVGNNAAFICPICGKVFIVSGMLHKFGRPCPGCRKSTAYVSGSHKNNGEARIEWNE
jgi:hypothetical protein